MKVKNLRFKTGTLEEVNLAYTMTSYCKCSPTFTKDPNQTTVHVSTEQTKLATRPKHNK